MANESDSVYNTYLSAMNARKIQVKNIEKDGQVNFIDATYNNLKTAGYEMELMDKGIIVSASTKSNYDSAAGSRDLFIALETGRINSVTSNTVDAYKEVYSASQLVSALNSGGKIRLMADIDMSETPFTSKAFNNSELDGNGHTISGLTSSLFTTVTNSTVKNLSLDSHITQGSTTSTTGEGILACRIGSNTTVENISITGSISVNENEVGALAGAVAGDNIKISKCSSTADIQGTQIVGFIGSVQGTTDTNSIVISDCSNNASINAKMTAGGLAAYITQNTTIKNSSANCNITVTDNVKNMGNTTRNPDTMSGGFIGAMTTKNVNVENCSSSGSIIAINQAGNVIAGFVGAITGYDGVNNGIVSNCNSYTNVDTTNGIGDSNTISGFVGAQNAGAIKNSNAFGTVTTNNTASGFTGGDHDSSDSLTPTIDNCYSSSSSLNFAPSLSGVSSIETPNNNVVSVTPPTIKTYVTNDADGVEEAGKLFDLLKEKGCCTTDAIDGHEDSTKWLTNMVSEGLLSIYKLDSDKTKYSETNVATDTDLQEVADTEAVKRAEADYEAKMRKINRKETKIDTELSTLEAERTSIKTEQEGLKNIIKDNVNLTFKLFS